MSTSHIAKSATVGENVRWGEFCVIGENVTIGADCQLGHHVIIHDDTEIGEGVRIDDGTIIGKLPSRAPRSRTTVDGRKLNPCTIGRGCKVGSNAVIYRGATIRPLVLVADLSTIRENVEIGEKTIVGRGVAVENECTIGRRVKLETNVYVTAKSKIGDYCFLAPCVATSNDNFMGRTRDRAKYYGGVVLERGARLGVNSTVLPGLTIGEDAVLGAGAVATKDIPREKIHAGIPAKYFKDVPADQLLDNQAKEDLE